MGCFDSYCFICGSIAIGSKIDIFKEYEIEKLNNYLKEKSYPIPLKLGLSKTKKGIINNKLLENYKKYLQDLKKLNLKWLANIIILTKDKIINGNKIKYNYSGTFISKTKKKKLNRIRPEFEFDVTKLNWKWTAEYGMIQGLVCHKNCYTLLCKQFKKKFNFEQFHPYLNSFSLLNKYDSIINRYTGKQYFHFHNYLNNLDDFSRIERIIHNNKNLKIEKKNLNYILDPLKNKENAKRILKLWMPIIKKFKPIKLRPSPSDSATIYKVGFKKIGNDGNMYIIAKNKNGIKRWKKYKN